MDTLSNIDEDILKSRQAWFWRRTTLQAALASLIVFLGYEVFTTAALDLAWTDVAVIGILVAAIAWLVTMYFAMVDSAEKVTTVVTAVGDAVDKARAG